jgi:hypothetical protein
MLDADGGIGCAGWIDATVEGHDQITQFQAVIRGFAHRSRRNGGAKNRGEDSKQRQEN